MTTVFDVAAYIISKQGPVTAMKLQKLVYYSQAWHIVWVEQVLFDETIEAWRDGPVCRDLWEEHANEFRIAAVAKGSADELSKRETKTVDKVLKYYGKKSPQWLSDLTHEEDPWRDARRGLPPGASSTAVITPAALSRYYSAL